ncbi:hypothetical protein L6452_39577 [Arctium lappa]|uniref:Uncharacterized protein n=1 Tax=Arctium lappa TaxID=4217 RepID=A0ACB8XWU7_ARCLA|nr:hypothetical protein L6452_39577 [Arctium lappa]
MAMDSPPEEMIADETQVCLPEQWLEAADAIAYDSTTSPPPICVVCGSLNSGKTNFSRHLLNVFISRYRRVCYLDTDVDQAEFTPPGCLSLTVIDKVTPDLAIPCLRTPERSFFFGDITPRRDPKIYLTYIHALYDYYYKNYQQSMMGESLFKVGVPLVVNAPGWVEDTGYDILVNMLKYIAPSHVVKVRADQSKNLPPGDFWLEEGAAQDVTVVEIDSDCQDSLKKTVCAQNNAHLLRDLRLVAYFRKCFPTNMSLKTIEELDHRLAAHPPYEIPMSTVTINQLHCQAPCNKTIDMSDITIVGLVASSTTCERMPCCVGLGIVRGVDTSRKILYLITPIPKHILKNVDILLHGFIKTPACLLQVQRHMTSNTRSTD